MGDKGQIFTELFQLINAERMWEMFRKSPLGHHS